MSRPGLSLALLMTLLASGLLLAGCGRPRPGDAAAEKPPGEAAPPAVEDGIRHPLRGEIIGVDAGRKTLLVVHEEIPGYMPAMTMEFTVGPGDLAIAREGRRIRATLVQRGEDFSLEKIWPDDEAANRVIESGAAALARDTEALRKNFYPFREKGDALPDFALYDQEARVVEFSRFRGKRVALNFIFTRCPVATMCPAATFNMATLQKRAKEAGVDNFELISITLDPAYDTPGVLREYASNYGIDTGNFSFLTGPEPAIQNLLRQLGIVTAFEGGVLRHSLATLLIDADGKILWRDDTTEWRPSSVVDILKKSSA